MFRLTHKLPRECLVAVSGGRDSMAGLHWLMRKSERVKGVIHINHGTGNFADDAEKFVGNYCAENNIDCYIHDYKKSGKDTEKTWRDFRYSTFHSFNKSVITVHQMDDALEEYIICVLKRGYIGSIPYSNKNVVRPFRLWRRKDINDYVKRYNIPYVEDPTNTDTKYLRNKVRHQVVPLALEINQGIYNMVEKAIEYQDDIMVERTTEYQD
jgi:tRNA(Ile)-lysidine synthase